MSNPPKTALEYFDSGAANYEASTGGSTRDVARHIVDLCSSFDSSSIILDNACGNGIVAQEILLKCSEPKRQSPIIYCVDGAPAMVNLARSMLSSTPHAPFLTFSEMPGEHLSFADEQFTHSITNMGIMFFEDPVKGAKEIFRTLKPGGVAVVTCWADLGYLDVIHRAQKAVRPNEPIFQVPIPKEWFLSSHFEKTLQEGGFLKVVIHEKKVHYGAKSAIAICDNLLKIFGHLTADLSEEEKAKFNLEMQASIEAVVEDFQRPALGGVENMVGIPMKALVAIARK